MYAPTIFIPVVMSTSTLLSYHIVNHLKVENILDESKTILQGPFNDFIISKVLHIYPRLYPFSHNFVTTLKSFFIF